MIYAIVGAGGKTGLLKEMADQFRQEGKSVFITTTTQMFIEEDTLLIDDPSEMIDTLQNSGYVFAGVPEEEIKSTGYVVDSLEAAIWSLITTDTFKEGLIKAVNLGEDTDTVGAIAGGLAGLYYGYESLPEEWRKSIIKENELLDMCGKM